MDPNFQFDAPMYVDFQNAASDDGVDSWFDSRLDDDAGVQLEADSLEETSVGEQTSSETFLVASEPNATESKSYETEAPIAAPEKTFKSNVNEGTNTSDTSDNKKPEDRGPILVKPVQKLPNICASTEEFRQKTRNARRVISQGNQPLKANHSLSIKQTLKREQLEDQQKEKQSSKSDPNAKKSNDNRSRPVLKPRRSPRFNSQKRDPSPCANAKKRDLSPCPISKKRDPSPVPNQGLSRQPSPKLRQNSISSNTSVSSGSASPPKKRKSSNAGKSLTVPNSPTMMRRAHNKSVNVSQKSKEEEELETIAKLQKETKKKIEKNEQFMKKALLAQPYMPHRSVEDNVTFPEEFHFATDERIKNAPKQEEKKKDFAETLRKHPLSPTFKNRGPTIPVPFHFHATCSESQKRKLDDDEDKPTNSYVTMAQKIYHFHSDTPDRFRTKPLKEQNEGPETVQTKAPLKLTNPRTPKLLAGDRKRKLPDNIMSREQEEEKIAEEIKNYKFKATKFDPRIIATNGCYGIKTVPKKPITEPQPFSFEYDQRAEQHKLKEQMVQANEAKPEPFKANPVPNYDKVSFKPELKHRATDAAPFSFEERNKEMLAKKEQKIQAIIQEEKSKASDFEAKPLPDFSPPKLRSSTKVLTEPVPFNLSCDYKGAAKAEKWIQKVRDELKEQKMKTVFKAHPSNVVYNAPFMPKKSLKPCTEFEEFDLNTERRREAREIYEMARKEQERVAEAEALQKEKEREEEERINLIQLRKQLVHKPNPIRKFKVVKVQPSQQPLTIPESPAWSERKTKKIRL